MNSTAARLTIIVLGALFISLSLCRPVFAAEQKVMLKVPAMNCASHIPLVTFIVRSVDGVLDMEGNFSEQILTLTFDSEKTTIEAIKDALKKANYPVSGEPEFIKE